MIDENEVIAFIKEAQLMKSLPQHPNILKLVGICGSPFCIITGKYFSFLFLLLMYFKKIKF